MAVADDIAECFRLIREAFPDVQVAAYAGPRSTDFMMELTGSVDWLRVPHDVLYAGGALQFVMNALPSVVLGDPKTGMRTFPAASSWEPVNHNDSCGFADRARSATIRSGGCP